MLFLCMRFAIFLLTALIAQAQIFKLDDYGKLARLSEPRFAPDGESIVLVTSRPDYVDDIWASEVVQVDLKSHRSHSLTPERKTARHPRWSPNGDRLAFLADITGKAQIFVLRMSGGEAKQITSTATGVQSFEWKPDGSAFAYLSPDEPPKRNKYDDAFEVEANDYLMRTSSPPVHLWTVAAEGGQAKRITSGTWSIAAGGVLSWTPAGDRIAFVSQPSPGTRDSDKRTAQTVRLDGSAPQPIPGAADQLCWMQSFSPDGRWISMACPLEGQPKNQTELRIVSSEGSDWKNVTRSVDRNFSRGVWTSDSKAIIAPAADGSFTGLWSFPISEKPQRWNFGKLAVSGQGSVDVSRTGQVAVIATSPSHPAELYLASNPAEEPARVTDLNAEIAGLKLGKTESLFWKSDDGLPLSGVLTFPPDFDSGRKYPLVLLIHGGPWGSSEETFSERAQFFAGHDWVVFEPNYRGSDNAGNRLFSAVYRDHGAGPGRDIMAALADVKKRPYIDTDRIGVSGWSYGGFMTTWLIGHYQGWKAAMAGAAVIDLVDDYNLNDLRLYLRAYGNTLTMPEDLKLMKEQSPMSGMEQMKTPLLMLSDAADVRVPITQSYKLFHALKERNRDVHMVVYPVAGHTPADPYRARDIDKRWAEWFVERLK